MRLARPGALADELAAGVPVPATHPVAEALPFLGVLCVFLIIVTYVPFLSTWLPTQVMGPETIVK